MAIGSVSGPFIKGLNNHSLSTCRSTLELQHLSSIITNQNHGKSLSHLSLQTKTMASLKTKTCAKCDMPNNKTKANSPILYDRDVFHAISPSLSRNQVRCLLPFSYQSEERLTPFIPHSLSRKRRVLLWKWLFMLSVTTISYVMRRLSLPTITIHKPRPYSLRKYSFGNMHIRKYWYSSKNIFI
ncbi:hypothetical protein AMTR_s00133p00097540 [Amborella trichopoda]|uniref:Uncharacterized protein n=1 Tax=Amborella trichopoda TaxID=13333 RepID=W1P9Z6_AMBTC|nr:hypothetical protein AMTR_s00133p00097540 [Amborella trichopoda]